MTWSDVISGVAKGPAGYDKNKGFFENLRDAFLK